jgi:hypothetical protein
MNVMAFDPEKMIIFVACSNKIKCLKISNQGFKESYKEKLELALIDEHDEIN